MNRLGCSTMALARWDLEPALKTLHEIGFTVIDLAVIEGVAEHYDPLGKTRADHQALAKKVRSLGFSVSTLNVNAGAFNDPQTRDKHFAKVKAALDCASVLGCCGVTTQAGNANGDWEAQAKESVRRIRDLADHAHALKLKLSLEIPHRGTIAGNLDQAVRFFQMVEHTSVDVTLDSSHLYACRADFRETPRQFIGKLGHAHLRDADENQTHLVPGEGKIDFKFFHDMLNLAGFHRDYAIEIRFPEGKTLDDIQGALAKARDYLLPAIGQEPKKKKGGKEKSE